MDSPWMCLQQQQRPELTLPSSHNENYRALAAAALQEIRSRDSSNKQLLAQAPMQMWQQQQPPPQAQQQQHQQQQLKQGMHQMGGVVPAGPLLQLPGSQPQSPMDLGGGVSSQVVSRYGEADLDMSSSPSMSPSFALQSMLGRLPTSGPLCPGGDNGTGHYSSILQSNQNALQGSNFVARDPQVLFCRV